MRKERIIDFIVGTILVLGFLISFCLKLDYEKEFLIAIIFNSTFNAFHTKDIKNKTVIPLLIRLSIYLFYLGLIVLNYKDIVFVVEVLILLTTVIFGIKNIKNFKWSSDED